MKWLRRALTAIKRNPAKTAILLLLIFVIGNVIAAAISIYKAVSVTEQSVYERAGTIATIDLDGDRLNAEVENGELAIDEITEILNDPENWATPEIYEQVGSLSCVEYYDYTVNMGLSSFDGSVETRVKETGNAMSCVPDDFEEISIKSTSMSEPMEFKADLLKITDGRFFTESELSGGKSVILISKELAELNNLEVGSVIVRQENLYGVDEEANYDYDDLLGSYSWEFEVIGMFEIVNPDDSNDPFSAKNSDSQIENMVYTTSKALSAMREQRKNTWYELRPEGMFDIYSIESPVQYENYFVLSSPNDVETFKAEAEQYLPPYNKVTVTSDFYEPLAAPLKSMKSIALNVLYISIGVSILILGLAVTLFLRDRRHEIGIYMSLGERKIKILLQIVSEVLIVAIIGMTLSMFTGNMISSVVSEKIVNEQVIAQQEELERLKSRGEDENESSILHWMGYSKLVDGEYIIDNYSVSLTADVVFIFYAAGLATVILSTSLPLIYVMRLKPKKVLMMEN